MTLSAAEIRTRGETVLAGHDRRLAMHAKPLARYCLALLDAIEECLSFDTFSRDAVLRRAAALLAEREDQS